MEITQVFEFHDLENSFGGIPWDIVNLYETDVPFFALLLVPG